jgi:L-lactate dehydrogenase complex protein LldF
MTMTAREFKAQAAVALADGNLQRALAKAKGGFVGKRRAAVEALPEFAQIRAAARAIKNRTLADLDTYLEQFERKVEEGGGTVHWARTPAEACEAVKRIIGSQPRQVLKGKSMVSEEIGLNHALEQSGHTIVETDLGEYIIQLAEEPPSHIIAPAVHKTREQITDLFHAEHPKYGLNEPVTEVGAIVDEARQVLRTKFLNSDIGITGANFLIAETGSTVIVTNEGNGDLSQTLPDVHIVTASIEKVVPTLDDMSTLLRLLGRSATGQEITSYTTLSTGPRREGDRDGPREFHVVLLDNGRSEMLGNEFRDMLRCIRCGACLNHCPVYGAIGGHAYGWVYPGPMGSVLTPLMIGLENAADLPHACTLNGRCQEVCPMSIPLPDMLRALRFREHERRITSARSRGALRVWAFLARRPRLYQGLTGIGVRVLAGLARGRGRLRSLPLAAGWTASRDLPAPQGETFMARWRKR